MHCQTTDKRHSARSTRQEVATVQLFVVKHYSYAFSYATWCASATLVNRLQQCDMLKMKMGARVHLLRFGPSLNLLNATLSLFCFSSIAMRTPINTHISHSFGAPLAVRSPRSKVKCRKKPKWNARIVRKKKANNNELLIFTSRLI